MRFFQLTAKYVLVSVPRGTSGLLLSICDKLQGLAQRKCGK